MFQVPINYILKPSILTNQREYDIIYANIIFNLLKSGGTLISLLILKLIGIKKDDFDDIGFFPSTNNFSIIFLNNKKIMNDKPISSFLNSLK